MRRVKITTIILGIILVTLVAFAGVYVKTQNRMENKVKDYTFGRELNGGRVIELKVATAEGSKPKPEDLTVENYEIVKKTIENRLNNFEAQDYTVSLNKEDGTILVELPEDSNVEGFVYSLTASGEVVIKEKGTDTILLSDDMVKKALHTYTGDMEGKYQVYLDVYLTEEGQAKIEEIKNNYAIFEEEVEEIEKAEEEAKKKEEEKKEGEETTVKETTSENQENKEGTRKIAKLTIGGTEYSVTKIEKDQIRLKVGAETTNSTYINSYILQAAEAATFINSGKYPIQYEEGNRFETGNRFVYTDVEKEQLIYFEIAVAAVMLIIFVIFTIKYKTKGLLVSISSLGFVSILSLILRYTNVNISIEGLGAIIITLIINFRINQIMLNGINDIDYKDLLSKLAPVIIITLVFSFAGWSNLSSFGMIMFWGLLLIAVYNVIVTKTLLKLKESK